MTRSSSPPDGRERGYRAVTVPDIAADAGVSAALVMKLFLSKESFMPPCSLTSRCSPSWTSRRRNWQGPRVPRADATPTRNAGALG
jgi:hypothetical protein